MQALLKLQIKHPVQYKSQFMCHPEESIWEFQNEAFFLFIILSADNEFSGDITDSVPSQKVQ